MVVVGYDAVAIYLAALTVSAAGALARGRSRGWQRRRSRWATVFLVLWGGLFIFVAIVAVVIAAAAAALAAGVPDLVPYTFHVHPTHLHLHTNFELPQSPLYECDDIPAAALGMPPYWFILFPALVVGLPFAVFAHSQRRLRRVHGRLAALRDEARSRRLAAHLARVAPDAARRTEVLVVPARTADMLSFAVLKPRRRPPGLMRDVVVVTTATEQLLDEDELAASLAHEVAHLEAGDGRYLPFFRALRSVMLFDPAVAYVSRRLCSEAEFLADDRAARLARSPRVLGRALFKVATAGAVATLGAASHAAAAGEASTAERIDRLLEKNDRAAARARPKARFTVLARR